MKSLWSILLFSIVMGASSLSAQDVFELEASMVGTDFGPIDPLLVSVILSNPSNREVVVKNGVWSQNSLLFFLRENNGESWDMLTSLLSVQITPSSPTFLPAGKKVQSELLIEPLQDVAMGNYQLKIIWFYGEEQELVRLLSVHRNFARIECETCKETNLEFQVNPYQGSDLEVYQALKEADMTDLCYPFVQLDESRFKVLQTIVTRFPESRFRIWGHNALMRYAYFKRRTLPLNDINQLLEEMREINSDDTINGYYKEFGRFYYSRLASTYLSRLEKE